MELTIFNSILFNELRPWKEENCRGDSFSKLIRFIGKGELANSKDLFSRIKSFLKDYPQLTIFNENYLEINDQPLFKPLFEFSIPAHFNTATEFYADLLKLESARILNNVSAAVNGTDNTIDKYYRSNTAWNNLRYVAEITSIELIDRGLTTIPDYKFTSTLITKESASRNTHYVLYLLKQYSSRLFFEIQFLFKDHLKTIETTDQFYIRILKQSLPVDDPLKHTPDFYRIQAKQIIESSTWSEENVLKLLEEVTTNLPGNSHDTINIIGALENYVFLNQFNIKSKNSDFESLSTSAKSNDLYDKTKKLISNELKNKVYGHQGLEIIHDKMEVLSNLNLNPEFIPTNKLSAPRRLKEWLKQQENIYITNLNTVFSPEPDPSEELKRNPKPLAKKSKAQLEEYKTKATELLKFMSGVNIQNIQIMSDAEFTRMMRYTYELIEKEELPVGIIPIPHTHISTQIIRYTFYLIHKSIYGTSRIKDVWIDFLHSVFKQFESAQKTTTKTKFSKKPSLYDSDLKKMQG